MSEPVTPNKTLIVPNTGDLVAAWGTSAMNPNFQLIDAMFGGVTTLSVGAATTITLAGPATTGIWGGLVPAGSNAKVKITGTQSGDTLITLALPGFYIVDNKTTPTETWAVGIFPNGPGNFIGIPQGVQSHIFYDGTDVAFVNLGLPGTALDLHGWTSVPRWMTIGGNQYLLKDGTSYSTVTYPYLAHALRGAFGNSDPVGVSFFVPDEMARARIAFDKTGTGRLTSVVSGVNGTTMGSAGGSQSMASHQHANSLNDPGHLHSGGAASGGLSISVQQNPSGPAFIINGNTGVSATGMSITNATTGSGSSQNVQPSIVSFLPLIKT